MMTTRRTNSSTTNKPITCKKLAIDTNRNSELKDDATATSIAIAQKLRQQGVDVSVLMSGAGLDK